MNQQAFSIGYKNWKAYLSGSNCTAIWSGLNLQRLADWLKPVRLRIARIANPPH